MHCKNNNNILFIILIFFLISELNEEVEKELNSAHLEYLEKD